MLHGYVGNLLYIEEHGFKVRTLNDFGCLAFTSMCVVVVVVVRDSCQN